MLDPEFFACGLNHESAPVAVREAFAFSKEASSKLYDEIKLSPGAEWMLVSTCNRTEVYLYGAHNDVRQLLQFLKEHSGRSLPRENGFFLTGKEAIVHIVQVTSGLKSLVLGDSQIFAQVKEAYRLAVEAGTVGTVLHRLLHTAFHCAKRITTETSLKSGIASIPAAAVFAARDFFEEASDGDRLRTKRTLVVGAGQMAQLLVTILHSYDPAEIVVTNRSLERAHHLSGSKVRVTPWKERYRAVEEADIVFVASGANEYVLKADKMPVPFDGKRKLLVDIAVPRNIDPGIDRLPGYHVLDLDRLNHNWKETEQRRREAVPDAERICSEELEGYLEWAMIYRRMQPTVRHIHETLETIRRQEVERHAHRFSAVDHQELDRLTRSIMEKLLAIPIVQLKNMYPKTSEYEQGLRLLDALFSRPRCEEHTATIVPLNGSEEARQTSRRCC